MERLPTLKIIALRNKFHHSHNNVKTICACMCGHVCVLVCESVCTCAMCARACVHEKGVIKIQAVLLLKSKRSL